MPDVARTMFALLLSLAMASAQAQDTPPEAVAADVAGDAALPLRLTVPAGTELVFEMGQAVGSKTSQRGDRFTLRLALPLRIDGHLLVPAGTPAMGEVVHADRARGGGQAGELILAARYLEWDGRQLPLKAFSAGVGKNRTNAALGVTLAAGVAGFLVRGGEIEMAAGSLITAKLRETTELPAVAGPEAPAAPEAPESTQHTTEATTGEDQP